MRHARQGKTNILIAPAVVYEALRLKNGALRDAIVRLMTNSAFRRLMPEAYSESMELLRAIEWAHPEWLRPEPDLQFFNRLLNDWKKTTGGFWVRCKKAPEREAQYLETMEGAMIQGAQAQAINARREMIDANWKRNPSMDKTVVAFNSPIPGWRGDPFEAWRMDSLTVLTHSLKQTGNPYRDWIAPFVELDTGLLESAAWIEFWVYLADKRTMPRQWLRWACSFAQRFRRVTPGTPGDSQLCTYFLEADAVVTADKILLQILEEIRPYAPRNLPLGRLVPAGAPGVSSLLTYLAEAEDKMTAGASLEKT